MCERRTDVRLGIFGGSFDPVHYGHLLLAEYCREHNGLDEVWFVPAAVSPHKLDRRPSSDKARVAMLELATGGHAKFRVSTVELDRGGVSFTVDTLRSIRDQRPKAELYFLMGSDSLADFHTWKEPHEICQLATPVVVARPNSPAPDLKPLLKFVDDVRTESLQRAQVEMPQIDISSTDLRRRVSTQRSIRFQTPRAVEKYIETQRLYVDVDEGTESQSKADDHA